MILHRTRIPFYLHVRAGRPVNPLAPSRRGLIQDAALAALEQFVADALFTFLATEPVKALQPAWIALAWSADPERARQLPVCVVAPLRCIPQDEPIWSADELNQSGERQVVRIDAVPLLLDEAVQVATATLPAEALAGGWFPPTQVPQRGPWQLADYGCDAFLPLLLASGRIPYTLIHGDKTCLPIQTVWWLPGPARADAFNERGTWGLGTRETPPAVFAPVPADVWAFTVTSNTDAAEVDWAVGTSDPLDFLVQRVWAGYGPDQESDMSSDEQERYYRESVAEWTRELVGDCVSSTFSHADLQRLMSTPTAPLHRLTFQYSPDVNAPTGVLVENAAGEQKLIRFLD